MENKIEAVKPPRSYDEFIERYASQFAAHPNELAMTVERDDDDGFRGGPGMGSPWGDLHKGTVMNTGYYLAVIDPAKTFAKDTMSLVLPVGSALLVHCHGTVTLEDRRMDVGTFDLVRIEETLADNDPERGEVHLPKWEIFVGDEAVGNALASVHDGIELLALEVAARKLGRPIKGVSRLDRARELKVDAVIADILVWMMRMSDREIELPAVAQHIATLKGLGIDRDEVRKLCVKKLENLLDMFLSRAFRAPR
jgi:hypothetical protein